LCFARRREVAIARLDEPGRVAEAEEELVLLAGEVLVMQMDPVELRQVRVEDVVVPDLLVLDPGVREGERDRVVPRWRVGRRVDGDARRLLERHRIHVPLGDLLPDGRHRAAVGGLEGDAGERRTAPDARQVGDEERAAAVVEQPLAADVVRERAEDDPVGLEVIGLRVIHRHEEMLGARLPRRTGDEGGEDEGAQEPAADGHDWNQTQETAPRRASSSRRACGTRALRG
jgi:hypothetical protein